MAMSHWSRAGKHRFIFHHLRLSRKFLVRRSLQNVRMEPASVEEILTFPPLNITGKGIA
jgi:hypothetical protein